MLGGMRVVCLSDTHERHEEIGVPDGDLLLHAGDFTNVGDPGAVLKFAQWLATLPHPHKVVVPGNHDWLFQKDWGFATALMSSSGAWVLDQRRVVLDGLPSPLTIYGEPRQPEFCEWAFNVPRERMRYEWAIAPRYVDIVLTHGPPLGVCDATDLERVGAARMGDKYLREYVEETQPKLVVCGHNHAGYGEGQIGRTKIVNAAICDEKYEPTHAPIVVEL